MAKKTNNEEMDKQVGNALKSLCVLSKASKRDCLKELELLNAAMKITVLTLSLTKEVDEKKLLKITKAGKSLEKLIKKTSGEIDEIIDVLADVSELTKEDEEELLRSVKNKSGKDKKMLSDEDNEKLNKLLGDV